jgi:MIP family channel proteins
VTPSLLARCLAEFAGTALLVAIGTGTIVGAAAHGGIPAWAMALAWTAAVLVPILIFVHVSGAHLNPAVTFALAASGRIGWQELPPYVLSQFAGAFLGSAAVATLFGWPPNLGATIPSTGDLTQVAGGEMAFTALLIVAVFTLSDRGEGPRRLRLLLPPLAVGLSTLVIGPITGSSLNPARSVAPAVLSGSYSDLWVYLVVIPVAAGLVALAWRPRSVDRLDRGPGREGVAR